jgi:spore coat polysaccharide biosynthesis protein SpsF (cytidylyltransferase family)
MEYKTIAILQARMSSTRLPGKVMRFINGKPMIYWQIQRIKKAKLVDKLILAISEDISDDVLAEYLGSINQVFVRGSLNDVFDRFMKVESIYKSQSIVRLTGDCPLVMPELIDEIIEQFYKLNLDYMSNTLTLTFPDGLDVEIFKSDVLDRLLNLNLSILEREHVTLGVINRQDIFSTRNYFNDRNISSYRWTVDNLKDFEFVSKVFAHFELNEVNFSQKELEEFVQSNPEINQIKIRRE